MPTKAINNIKYINLAIFTAMTGFFAFSYLNFASFKPSAYAEVQSQDDAIKSIATQDSNTLLSLPHPINAQKLATDTNDTHEQLTLTVNMPANKVHEFYKSTLIQREWKLTDEETHETTQTKSYKKGKNRLTITTALAEQNQEETVVSIEIQL